MLEARSHREAFVAPDAWNVFGGGTPTAAVRSVPLTTGMPSSWKPNRREPAGMKRIGEILVGAGVISDKTRDRVLEYQHWKRVSFGTALLEVGAVSEKLLLRALSVQTSAPGASAADLESIPPDILAMVKPRIVERFHVIPFRKSGRTLHLAMAQPNDNPAIRTIARLAGCTIVPHVAIAARVVLAIEKHYGVPAAPHFKALAKVLDEVSAAVPEAAPEAPAPPPDLPDSLPRIQEPPLSPLPWPELTRALCEARDADQIASALLSALQGTIGPAALFLVRGDDVNLWRSLPAAAALARGLSIPFSGRSLFSSLRDTAEVFAGPCPDTWPNRQILASIGGGIPGTVVVIPVNMRERTVLYIVGRPGRGDPPLDNSTLGRLANITATALASLALRRRLLSL